jgi:hypothetical protein
VQHWQNEKMPVTSLYIASERGYLGVVGALLAKGADMEAKTNVSIEERACFCVRECITKV